MKKENGFQYYKDVFSSPNSCYFDEYLHKGISDLWKHYDEKAIYDIKHFDDICVLYSHYNFLSVFNPEKSNYLIFQYQNNKLYRIFIDKKGVIRKEETLYAHFQKREIFKIKTTNFHNYLIIPNSFIDYQEITIKSLYRWAKKNTFKHILYKTKKRIHQLFN